MDSYTAGSRDPSGRERTDSWTSAHRRRSQSPPARDQRDRMPDHYPSGHERDGQRRSRADQDAPATILARKPSTAGTSSLPSRPDASTSRAASIPSSSSSPLSRADLVSRIVASAPERSLFDCIEEKRRAIAEHRVELGALLKKIKQTQDLLIKASASNEQQLASFLRKSQQSQSDLEHTIAVESDNLYRMQVEWQLALIENLIPSLISSASLPPDPRLEELRADMRAEHKFVRDVDGRARVCSGLMSRFQSDLSKVRADGAALSKDQSSILDRVDRIAKDVQDTRVQLSQDLHDTKRELRRDLDKDVAQITQNQQRIRRLEKDYGYIKQDAAAAAAAAASRAVSTASTSPRPSHAPSMRATSPTRDPRSRPTPKPSADVASAATSTIASASAAPTTTANAAPSQAEKSSTDEPVTRSQFRKWMRDFQRDLEIQFDELKDLAVQEATAENQACMEERIQALALKWRNKLAAGFGDKDAAAETDKQATSGSNANAAPSDTTPMDVDASAAPNAAPEAAVAVETLPAPAPAAASTSTSTSTSSQPSPAPTNSATAAPQTTSTDAATTATQSDSTSVPTPTPTPAPAPAPVTASVSSPSPATNAADAVVADGSSVADAAKLQTKGKTAPVLQMVFSILESFKAQITAVEKKLKEELDSVRTLDRKEFDALLSSPEQLKQLAAALKQHSDDAPAVATLPDAADTVSSAVVSGIRDVQTALVERLQVIEQWKVEFVFYVDRKAAWLQKQLEVLDDQSSLQGALLIKLAEHANPRRLPPTTPATAAVPTPPLPSPVARAAMPPVVNTPPHPAAQPQPHPQPHPQVYRTVQQQQPTVLNPSVIAQPVQSASDVAALSAAHMSGVYNHPPHVQQQHQQQHQHQQHQPHQPHQQHPLPQRPYSHAGPGYP